MTTPKTTTTVLYKCACMPAEVSLEVPNRRADQDVADWVENTMGAVIGADHCRRSALCIRSKMEYAKIHVPENAPFIGGAPKLNS